MMPEYSDAAAHGLIIFTFTQTEKWAWLFVEPFFFRAPVSVLVRFVATVAGELLSLFGAEMNYIAENRKLNDCHFDTSCPYGLIMSLSAHLLPSLSAMFDF
jgi:hypothetical protein